MLLEAGELRPTIAQLIDAYPELEQHRLNRGNWEVIEATKTFVEPFFEAIQKLETAQVMLDKVQESIEALIWHCKQSEIRHAGNKGLSAAINISWHSFNTWYEKLDNSPFYVTALLLHSSQRLEGLKRMWKDYKGHTAAGVARARML